MKKEAKGWGEEKATIVLIQGRIKSLRQTSTFILSWLDRLILLQPITHVTCKTRRAGHSTHCNDWWVACEDWCSRLITTCYWKEPYCFFAQKAWGLLRHKPALFSNRLPSKFLGLLLQNIPNTFQIHRSLWPWYIWKAADGKDCTNRCSCPTFNSSSWTTISWLWQKQENLDSELLVWIINILNLFSVHILGKTQPIHQFGLKFLHHWYTSELPYTVYRRISEKRFQLSVLLAQILTALYQYPTSFSNVS